MSETKYGSIEISDYEVEKFLKDFQELFFKRVNEILIGTLNHTKNEVRDILWNALKNFMESK